jgi:hypothetical protein
LNERGRQYAGANATRIPDDQRDAETDRLIYAVYGLTDAERRFIEHDHQMQRS